MIHSFQNFRKLLRKKIIPSQIQEIHLKQVSWKYSKARNALKLVMYLAKSLDNILLFRYTLYSSIKTTKNLNPEIKIRLVFWFVLCHVIIQVPHAIKSTSKRFTEKTFFDSRKQIRKDKLKKIYSTSNKIKQMASKTVKWWTKTKLFNGQSL